MNTPVEFKRWKPVATSPEEFACAAPDHSPFCRLCQRVDNNPTFASLLESVASGDLIVVGCNPDGEFLFSVTDQSVARVKAMGPRR